MTAHFIVRAHVEDASARDEFDQWYQHEHLPEALVAFNAKRAWRGWSEVDPMVHFAFYEFESLPALQAISDSQALKALIAEFDRKWGHRVTRARDIVPIMQQLSAQSE